MCLGFLFYRTRATIVVLSSSHRNTEPFPFAQELKTFETMSMIKLTNATTNEAIAILFEVIA